MSHVSQPPGRPDEPDKIDRLFATYFRQQLPKSWPAFVPVPTATPLRAGVGSGRSRATLAAAVAMLLGFGLVLSDSPQPHVLNGESQPGTPGLLKNATAQGPNLSSRNHTPPEDGKGSQSP